MSSHIDDMNGVIFVRVNYEFPVLALIIYDKTGSFYVAWDYNWCISHESSVKFLRSVKYVFGLFIITIMTICPSFQQKIIHLQSKLWNVLLKSICNSSSTRFKQFTKITISNHAVCTKIEKKLSHSHIYFDIWFLVNNAITL